MVTFTEKELDAVLNNAVETNPDFLRWFVHQTKFRSGRYKYLWSRSDHPWGTIDFERLDPATNGTVYERRQSETDILVVLEGQDGGRVALHIENKLSDGHFTEYQAEMYSQRAKQWMNKEKFKSYTDFQTILIAPQFFYNNNIEKARLFDCYISHEDIGTYLAEFALERT
ncbi:hypothetical protein [Vibrio coralliirubri]|uniref:hypothetical protein n=1 Tax=Vibrio coralliirubri TaxID=1516159 RepID=UPI000A381EC6|nr:hypothetical protein [Vibrio coralliirubri]